MTIYRVEKEELELSETGTGRRWKAARFDGHGEFDCYLNGSSAFELERDGGRWIVRNDAPHSSQYSSRKQYLRALAQGIHERTEIASCPVDVYPTLEAAFEWAIEVYKDKGWITRDPFSDSLTMERVKKRLAA
jgi:hypothetical protein